VFHNTQISGSMNFDGRSESQDERWTMDQTKCWTLFQKAHKSVLMFFEFPYNVQPTDVQRFLNFSVHGKRSTVHVFCTFYGSMDDERNFVIAGSRIHGPSWSFGLASSSFFSCSNKLTLIKHIESNLL
jgi:hypothetical protein